MPNRLPTSTPLTVLVSELFRIIIFVSERHPRGSKLKLSFLAFTRMKERERERMEDGKRWADTKTERDRAAGAVGEISLASSPRRADYGFLLPRAKAPLPALSSCFSACPTPKSARLNLPWNFGALPPAMQRTLPRGSTVRHALLRIQK